MKRSSAIHAAKEAYRLWLTRAIKCPGFIAWPQGYTLTIKGWCVELNNQGRLVQAVRI